jgi:hypothetical protein
MCINARTIDLGYAFMWIQPYFGTYVAISCYTYINK